MPPPDVPHMLKPVFAVWRDPGIGMAGTCGLGKFPDPACRPHPIVPYRTGMSIFGPGRDVELNTRGLLRYQMMHVNVCELLPKHCEMGPARPPHVAW